MEKTANPCDRVLYTYRESLVKFSFVWRGRWENFQLNKAGDGGEGGGGEQPQNLGNSIRPPSLHTHNIV